MLRAHAAQAELSKVKLLPFSLQREGLLRLNSEEQIELMRRRKWEIERDQQHLDLNDMARPSRMHRS